MSNFLSELFKRTLQQGTDVQWEETTFEQSEQTPSFIITEHQTPQAVYRESGVERESFRLTEWPRTVVGEWTPF
jgi:hypothetical protein